MGCFDTLIMKCPYCNEEVTDQYKPGYMNTYRFGEDPDEDMKFEGSYTCEHCKESFVVEFEREPRMVIRKVES